MIPNPLNAAEYLGRTAWYAAQAALNGLAGGVTSFAELVGTTSASNAQAGLRAIRLHQVVAKTVVPCLKNAGVTRSEVALVVADVASELGAELEACGAVVHLDHRVVAFDASNLVLSTSTCSH